MSAPYTGTPTSAQSPSLAPGPGIVPIVTIPADPDGASWANITQLSKVPADSAAYLMNGHFSSFMQENFMVASTSFTTSQTPVTNYAPLRVIVSGAAWTVPFGVGKAAINPAATASGDSCYVAFSSSINNNSLGNLTQYSIEFDLLELGPSLATSTSRVGIGDNAVLDAAANYAYLFTTPGSSFWTLSVSGTTSALSATFNPAGVTQRIRIVGFGSGTATGVANGSAITKVYVNDVFATSVNACSTAVMFPSFGMKVTGNATGQSMTCNCITLRWNRF